MNFCTLSESEFANFEEKNPFGNVMQTVERAKLRERMGFSCFLLGVKKNDEVLAAGLAVEKNGEVWVQIGPILDWGDKKLVRVFLKGILDFCREKRFSELEIFPPVLLSMRNIEGEVMKEYNEKKVFEVFDECGFKHLGFTTKVENKALRWMFVKDLSELSTIEDIEASLRSNLRTKIRKARRELDVYILKDKNELKDWICPLRDSNERNGVPTRNLGYFENIWDVFGKKALFIEARQKENNAIVASELCFIRQNEFLLFLAGLKAEYKNKNGIVAIKDWELQECLRRGITRLNFYGIEADFSKNNRLLEFKSSFNGIVEEYIGGFKIVLNPWRYFLNKIRKRLKR